MKLLWRIDQTPRRIHIKARRSGFLALRHNWQFVTFIGERNGSLRSENHHQRKCFESKETNKRDNMYVPWLHNSRGRHQSTNFKTFDRHLRRSAPSRGSPRKTWAAVGPKLTLRRWASLPFVAGSNLSGKQHDATTTECCRI